jgi:STAM-binding protein
MSQHQLKQGYAPSLQSMFINSGSSMAPASLFFVPENSSSSSSLYPSNALPRPSQPSQYPYGPPAPQHQHNTSTSPYPGYPGPTRNAPVPPPSVPPPPTGPLREDISRISRPANAKARADPVEGELKNVSVPRDCLPKFLSIAALNTSRNRETCGLLLGKDKGYKFTVTTLLIPKQHSTSDTCTMDEEELVMMFTEERSLITLGWVSSTIVHAIRTISHLPFIRSILILHSHVCLLVLHCNNWLMARKGFMSSVDLHTHSGFQRMLPESFAVVCAPKSTPK